jgi:hypothetical protein
MALPLSSVGMAPQTTQIRACAADDCGNPFEPKIPEQKYCSNRCANRTRVRQLRARRRHRLPDPPPSPGGPPNGGLHATLGGAVEYAGNGSVSDKSGYYVNYND